MKAAEESEDHRSIPPCLLTSSRSWAWLQPLLPVQRVSRASSRGLTAVWYDRARDHGCGHGNREEKVHDLVEDTDSVVEASGRVWCIGMIKKMTLGASTYLLNLVDLLRCLLHGGLGLDIALAWIQRVRGETPAQESLLGDDRAGWGDA